jgi:hypothetical protein
LLVDGRILIRIRTNKLRIRIEETRKHTTFNLSGSGTLVYTSKKLCEKKSPREFINLLKDFSLSRKYENNETDNLLIKNGLLNCFQMYFLKITTREIVSSKYITKLVQYRID